MKLLTLIFASAIALNSCEDKKTTEKTTETAVSDTVKVADSTVSAVNSPAEINPTAVAATVTENNSGTKPTLNPEHGQPFHRCDISVGAPIDSAPQQAAAPQSMPQQSASNNNFNTSPISPSIAAPSSAPQATGPKPALNPAHGEPHHRCDLQVGAPLT